MSCKKHLCALTEEVSPVDKTMKSVVIVQDKGPTIEVKVRVATLARMQKMNPELPINKIIEELLETFDW